MQFWMHLDADFWMQFLDAFGCSPKLLKLLNLDAVWMHLDALSGPLFGCTLRGPPPLGGEVPSAPKGEDVTSFRTPKGRQ